MSSCSHNDVLSRRLRWIVLALALLACRSANAQGVGMEEPPVITGSSEPFMTGAAGRTMIGTTPLRIWHRTRGYGMEASETAFGGRLAVDFVDAVGFIDGQFRISNESRGGANIGGGFRWRTGGLITSDPRIFGLTGWYDGQETEIGNYFNQLGVSVESLGEYVDFRLNANMPLEDTKTGDDVRFSGLPGFSGNFLTQQTFVDADVPLRVVDFEIAPRIYNLNAWLYGGGYQMDGDGVSDFGAKGGARGYVTNDLAVDLGVSDDDVFGTTTSFQIIWTPGRVGSGPTSWIHTLADRMREPVYRNTYIAAARSEIVDDIALTDADGENIRVVHVDSNAGPGTGTGTFEDPLRNLEDIEDYSEVGDIILVHAESDHTNQFVTLQNGQRFLGEGDNFEHLVFTQELGETALPETSLGASALARPFIENGTDLAAIMMTVSDEDIDTFGAIEISNFDIEIDNTTLAILSDDNDPATPTGVGDININNLAISAGPMATGNAIELTPLVGTLANDTDQVRFRPTINEVTFTDIGGDDIKINAETTAPASTAILEAIAITNVDSTGGAGVGINLVNTKRTVNISDFTWDGAALTSLTQGAIRIEDAVGNVVVDDVGNDVVPGITGGAAGLAFGIAVINSAGTHTFTDTFIEDTGGDSVLVSDGAANMNFTGRIVQSNTAAVLNVDAGHTGNLTFREAVTGDGVIEASGGSAGLQFNDADGNYTFVHAVEMTGVSAGVNAVDSDGVITISNGTITDSIGTAVTFNGGDANMTFTGRIEQTDPPSNNFAVLGVSNGHTGTLTFNELTAGTGVIEANIGPGLVFDNADGAYVFNDEVLLNGGEASIDVLNDSEGTFTFADADITFNGTGGAVLITNSEVQAFTITGEIVSNGAGSRPVEITNNTGGDITIDAEITATNSLGILVDNNTDTDVLFTENMTLNTSDEAIEVSNNEDGRTEFDGDIAVTDSVGVRIFNNTDQAVVFDGETTFDTGAALAIEIDANDGGNVAFNDPVTVENDSLGLRVTNNTDLAVAFTDDASFDSGANEAVHLENNTDGSIAFNGLTIETTSGNGFTAIGSDNVTVAGGSNTIESTAGGIALNLNDVLVGAADINFESVSSDGATNGIILTNVRGGAVNIGDAGATGGAGGTIQNTTGAGIVVNNVATVNFNGLIIDTTGGDAIDVTHTGSAASTVRVSHTSIDNVTGIGIDYNRSATVQSRLTLVGNTINGTSDDSVNLSLAGSNNVDVTINGDNQITNSSGNSALVLNTSGAAKTVRLLIDDNDFNNDSTDPAVSITQNSPGTLNATVTDNTFTNSDAVSGRAYAMTSQAGIIRLDLNNNSGINANPTDEFLLTQQGGSTFNIVDEPNVEANQDAGNVEQVGTFGNDTGPLPQPTP